MSPTIKHNQQIRINPNHLSKNIEILLEKNKITEGELARILNIPYNTVNRLATGFTTDPRVSTLQLIADYFQISLDALMSEGDPTQEDKKKIKMPHLVPLFTWDDISKSEFDIHMDKSNWTNWYPIILVNTENLSEHAYALESKRSMQPRFPVGTIFIVDPITTPIDGDLILVRMLENDAVSLRDLIIDPPNWQLSPIHGNTPVLLYNENIHCIIGIIVFTIMQSRR